MKTSLLFGILFVCSASFAFPTNKRQTAKKGRYLYGAPHKSPDYVARRGAAKFFNKLEWLTKNHCGPNDVKIVGVVTSPSGKFKRYTVATNKYIVNYLNNNDKLPSLQMPITTQKAKNGWMVLMPKRKQILVESKTVLPKKY